MSIALSHKGIIMVVMDLLKREGKEEASLIQHFIMPVLLGQSLWLTMKIK